MGDYLREELKSETGCTVSYFTVTVATHYLSGISAMLDKLQFETSEDKGVLTVRMNGALNLTTSNDFRQNSTEWLNSGATHIILDMRKVFYIDSSGIGTLLQIINQIAAQGGLFNIINIPASLKPVFEMTGLSAILNT
jgi:anti-anti-sigma factor